MSKSDNPYLSPRPLPTGKVTPDEALRILRSHAGITLRDWFAGQALNHLSQTPLPGRLKQIAADAYAHADAMLLERDKGRG